MLKNFIWNILYALTRALPHHPRMTILLYHSISDSPDFFAVAPEVFDRQMRYVSERYEVVQLSRAFEHASGKCVEHDSVAISFDDGYRDFLTEVLPILERYRIPATVFVLGDNPDRAELGTDHPLLAPEDFAKFSSLITVGSHSLVHKKLTKMLVEDIVYEMVLSRESVKERVGTAPRYLAYPKGSYNEAVMRLASEAGYEGAVSVVERGVYSGDNAYALPRVQIDSTTTFRRFQAKLTQAADWYYTLWSLARLKRK